MRRSTTVSRLNDKIESASCLTGPVTVARSQQGFTLIEVLVSVLILLVGVLGVAGMQMVSLEANRGAFYRSQAIFVGSQILDSMRANASALDNYVITIDPADPNSVSIPADPGCATSVSGCTPTDMAAVDLRQWSTHFVDVFGSTDYRPTLPGGGAQIQSDGDQYTVTISWQQRIFDDTNATDGSDSRSVGAQTVELSSVITP